MEIYYVQDATKKLTTNSTYLNDVTNQKIYTESIKLRAMKIYFESKMKMDRLKEIVEYIKQIEQKVQNKTHSIYIHKIVFK